LAPPGLYEEDALTATEAVMHLWRPRSISPCLAGTVLVLLTGRSATAQPLTTRVSIASGGIQSNYPSLQPAISDDGRWVAFASSAQNLVPNDTNDREDVFVHDRHTGATTRVSIGSGGVQGNDDSFGPVISADGRWIAFVSAASNLVDADTNHLVDVFLHDREGGTTSRVSVGPNGVQGNLESRDPAISGDGRWVAFSSIASDLVEDDTNGESDVFVYDRQTRTTTRVSAGPGGVQADAGSAWPSISPDGRWLAFGSLASNLVAGDTNAQIDTFVLDRQTGAITRVNDGPNGVQANGPSWGAPSVSADGQRVAFQSAASNLAPGDTNGRDDVFVHDRQTGRTALVSVGPGGVVGDSWSEFPRISTDGRWVVFDSASALVSGDENHSADVFVFDVEAGTMRRVSVGPGGAEGNGESYFQAISADGRWIAFASWASNLVAGDTNGYSDIFVRDLDPDTPLAPEALRVESVVGSRITLRWTAPGYGPPPTGFVLEGGTRPGEVLASISTGSTAPTYSFVAPRGSFFVTAVALNGSHRSAPSVAVVIHANELIPPSSPASLLAVVNGSALTLAWRNTYEGGIPMSLRLEVTGPVITPMTLPLAIGETLSFSDVPPGVYTVTLRALNAAGASPPSNAVSVIAPGPCSGPPAAPTDVFAYGLDGTLHLAWAPGISGPAPTAYVVIVTGGWLGSFVTAARQVAGAAGPGSYTLSLIAVNPCGASAASAPVTVVVR
jgi:Tol biopolymer transport system component